MNCSFCGEVVLDQNDLQLHQADTCPVFQIDQIAPSVANVQFRWLFGQRLYGDVIHLLATKEMNNIELRKKGDTFESDFVSLKEGVYGGQLIADNDIIPVAEFVVNAASHFVYLQPEKEFSYASSSDELQNSDYEREGELQALQDSDNQFYGSGNDANHQFFDETDNVEQRATLGNKLSEEGFLVTSASQPDTMNKSIRTEDNTLRNITDFEDSLNEEEPTSNQVRNVFGNKNLKNDFLQKENSSNEPSNLLSIKQNTFSPKKTLSVVSDNGLPSRNTLPRDNKTLSSRPDASLILRQRSLSCTHKKDNAIMDEILLELSMREDKNLANGNNKNLKHGSEQIPQNGDESVVFQSYQPKNFSKSLETGSDGRGCSTKDDEDFKNITEAFEKQINTLKKEVQRLTDLNFNYKEIKSELETKCQSYDDEVARMNRKISTLQKEKDLVIEKSQQEILNLKMNINELEERCNSLNHLLLRTDREHQELLGELSDDNSPRLLESYKHRCEELEREKKTLSDSYQNLEAAHRLHDEEMKLEINNLQQVVDMLKKDQIQSKCFPFFDINLSNNNKKNIEKLTKENELLKSKLKAIRLESELSNNNVNSINPRNLRTTSSQDHVLYQSHEDKKIDRLDGNYKTNDFDANMRRNSPNSPPSILSMSWDQQSSRLLSSKSSIDHILKRYSSGSGSNEDKRKGSQYNEELRNGQYGATHWSSTLSRPKSHSLDRGLDMIGFDQGDYTKRSLTKVPFCPNTINDLTIGMKVSVSRSARRLSPGIVKWIGRLPDQNGDYIGVELENETGRNSGDFQGYLYFTCKPNCGVFVKFKKIIMAWK